MADDRSQIINPIVAQLHGGPLDGDKFELIPHGSVLPPMRFSYISRAIFEDGEEHSCWLHYECNDSVPEWIDESIAYHYAGKERIHIL